MATARCTWTAVSGVDGYNVYLKSNGEFVKQNTALITETTYDIEDLEEGNYEAYAKSVLNDVESDASNTEAFEVAAVSGDYFTDFTEFDNDTFPSTFIQAPWNAGNWKIDNGVLKTTVMPSDDIILLDAQDIDDCIIEMKYKSSGATASGRQFRLFGRADLAQGQGMFNDFSGYYCYVNVTSAFNMARIVNGSFQFFFGISISAPADTWIRLKLKIEGTEIRSKFWLDSNTEPENYGSPRTDTNLSSGKVGFGFTNATVIEVDEFSVTKI